MHKPHLWGNAPGNNVFDNPHLCSIDPVSAMVGGILPALFGGGGNKGSDPAPAPAAPPPPAPPATAPAPKQNSSGTGQTSFLGAVPTPPPSSGGGKSLLGQ